MSTIIQTKTGNLLHIKTGHIVHGCNAQGVMGSGVAYGIRQEYPFAYEEYRRIHETTSLVLGVAYPVIVGKDLTIWNAITQDQFGWGTRQVSYDAIQTCFAEINEHLKQLAEDTTNTQPLEVHIPMIGAARGGGNWKIIETIIEETMDFPVTLWLPDATVNTL